MPINIKEDSLEVALNKLKARENTLLQFEKISKLGSWEIDLKTKKSLWSKRSYEIYGIEAGSMVGLDTFFDMLLPKYHEEALSLIEDSIKTGEPKSFTCEIKRSDGKIISLLINAQVVFDDNNEALKLTGTTQDITQYIELKEQTKELSALIEHSSNEIYIVDVNTLKYLYVNKGASDALGYTKDELLSMCITDVNPYLRQTDIEHIEQELKKKKNILNRTVHQRRDGSHYHVQSYIHTLEYKNKTAFVIFDTDISQLIELEAESKKQAKILEHIHDSVVSVDNYGNIKTWNKGSENLFGYEASEIIGKSILNIYAQDNLEPLAILFSTLNEYGNIEIEATMLKKDSTQIICDISLSVLRDEFGIIDGYVGYIQDITQQKETQTLLEKQTKQLQYQAHHDMLTHLPNRTLFQDRLSQTIMNSKRNNEIFALLFIDLDQFKKINDSLGHHIGDEVLKQAAKRFKNALREDDTLARLGGDEFTIILKNIKSKENTAHVAQKIIRHIKEPIKVGIHTLHISSSIGIALYPNDAISQDNLIKYADVAMYKAKDEGRDNYQFYASELSAYAFERVIMENSLRVAIKENQFLVYYQPQFHAKDEKIIGMEALVRWQHPKLGLVTPDKFLPVAEETGLLKEIDNIVMREAMQQFKEWYIQGLNPGILALNLSMKQLNEKDFISKLLLTMSELGFNPQWLELEVTEGQVMNNPDISIEKLNKIHNIGVEIAIDDFGTGYSSLSYLKKLPLDKLKIDRSFIEDIPHDEDDIAITKAIIALGKSLNLKLIAEGVETKEQRDFLLQNECDFIQGYYYSKPTLAEDVRKFIGKN
ncbi:sensor domain-containing protein [Sulfurimonas sp.]